MIPLSARPLPPDDGIDALSATRRGRVCSHKRMDTPAEVDLGAIEAVVAAAYVARTMSPDALETECRRRKALGIPEGAVYPLPPIPKGAKRKTERPHRKKPRGAPSTRVPGSGVHAWRRCPCGKATRGHEKPCTHCGRLPARSEAA